MCVEWAWVRVERSGLGMAMCGGGVREGWGKSADTQRHGEKSGWSLGYVVVGVPRAGQFTTGDTHRKAVQDQADELESIGLLLNWF